MVLELIKKILDKEEFECALSQANSEFPFDRLLVFLGVDAKERERILQIIAGPQHVSPEITLPKTASLPFRIQFRVELPFKIQDLALNQVGSLIFFINQFIDLPGFELNELEGQVVYRYVWMAQPSSIDTPIIMSIVGAIMMNLALFNETIESLADGKKTFNQILAQIIKIAESVKK